MFFSTGEGEGQLQPQGPRCDLRACQQFQQMSERHGLTVSHCQHTRHADPRALTAAEEHLHAKILDEMVAAKILTEAKRAMCLRRQKMAQVAKVPFSVHVDLEGSPKRMFLSVHEPRANDYSCLGRVMVSYDVDSNVWLCPCTKGPMSCLHKSIARWHVFQTHRDLFKPPPPSCARDNKPSGGAWDSMEFCANANGGGGGSNSAYALNSDVKRSVDYIYEHKRIPATADLPGELTSTVLEFPGQLFPSETTCGMCGCAPALEEAENVTYQGKIVTMMGVADYVSTFIRRCPMCHMVYRYQEWRDGLHNFNNHLLLSIELCLYFRHSLQNNIPITKAVKTLESLRKTSYPAVETLLTAYSHFEAMMSPDADAHPDCCASPAPVTDLHKKAFLVLHWS
ncbi:uncharacterized protein LOC134467077 [Engraulis encrasicolus]|uniref:uncharacterized protein LOC134467077 n=1 Tax=Engraulis encrasicolus TaxID=184585 RepID=UPI002FD1EF3A